jgi:hypothetical protein
VGIKRKVEEIKIKPLDKRKRNWSRGSQRDVVYLGCQ